MAVSPPPPIQLAATDTSTAYLETRAAEETEEGDQKDERNKVDSNM